MADESTTAASSWAPLANPVYRELWLAFTVSTIGTWVHDVATAWLMTRMAPEPIFVGLIATAETIPPLLLALPAGALADRIDRRRLLLLTQSWMAVSAAVLGLLTWWGLASPLLLLGLTFTLSLGSALNGPAWHAVIPELVPSRDVPSAVALNSVAFNLARAVGPALGGLLIAAYGSASAFVVNAVSFLGVIAVLYRWQRPAHAPDTSPVRFLDAMAVGPRAARNVPALRAVLIRSGLFIVCASGFWALLPAVANQGLETNAFGYGLLLGCLGFGAVLAASLLARLRRRWSADALVTAGMAVFALVLVATAWARQGIVLAPFLVLGGSAWLIIWANLNASAQLSIASSVRARAMSVYILVFFAGVAAGSALWGWVATALGLPVALLGCAGGILCGLSVRPRLTPQSSAAEEPRPDPDPTEPASCGESFPAFPTSGLGASPPPAAVASDPIPD
jgi:MFS family permease